ncbi:MAG: ROK family protein [Chloroflexi bacterium]|nr:ROK family protein [Chloroflexota bacterium]MYC56434.1 ROK family protein [Chloroflexota bacterium]
MPEELAIGLDIGGTKMAFAIADRQGRIYAERTLPTKNSAAVEEFFDSLGNFLNAYIDGNAAICGIGIGVPGPVDSQRGLALQAANLGWERIPLRAALAARLSRRLPIFVDNDVNCGAIGEREFGCAGSVAHFVYLAVGTGLGGAVMIDNRLLRGASHSEMEIGHVSLDPVNGLPCACGMRGCLEMTVSGKGIVVQAHHQLINYPDSRLRQGEITVREIIKAAETGDSLASHVMREAGTALGIACAWCVNLFNPRLIVLAGGISQAAYPLLEAPLQRELNARSLPINRTAASIQLAKLKNAALGASALVWHHRHQEE